MYTHPYKGRVHFFFVMLSPEGKLIKLQAKTKHIPIRTVYCIQHNVVSCIYHSLPLEDYKCI